MELAVKKTTKMDYATVFITGTVILILEILGSRILATTFGNTTFVWSSMIGMTIVSLAIGYYIGGKIKNIPNILFYSTLTIFVSGMGYKYLTNEFTQFGVLGGSLLSAFALFSLPLIFLGAITPLVIKRNTTNINKVGENTGKFLAVGTIGSFLGAITTGFILIPNLTIPQILGITLFIISAITAYWGIKSRQLNIVFVPLLALILLQVGSAIQTVDGLVYETESMYGNIKVIETDHHKILLVDNAIQSMVEKGSMDSSIGFVRYSIIPVFYTDVKDVLVIGLGAGSISHEYNKLGIETETVEIDPKILDVAINHFHVHGKVHIEDGRYFLKTTEQTYDVIIYDVTNSDSYPIHLFTKEAYTDVKNKLNENGMLLMNLAGDLESERIKSYYKTLSTVFEDVDIISFTTPQRPESMQQIFIATNNELYLDIETLKTLFPNTEGEIFENVLTNQKYESLDGGKLITDDYNPLDIMQYDVADQWRQTIWEYEWFE